MLVRYLEFRAKPHVTAIARQVASATLALATNDCGFGERAPAIGCAR